MKRLVGLALLWLAASEAARRLPESPYYDDSTPDRLEDELAERGGAGFAVEAVPGADGGGDGRAPQSHSPDPEAR